MDNLIKDLKNNNIGQDYIKIAIEYRSLFKIVLIKYYEGNIIDAYNLINNLIKEYKKNNIIFF